MTSSPGPHGQSALMFHEGLALLLTEKSVLLKAQVAETIRGVIEVKQEIAEVGESVVFDGLLHTIARSTAAAPVPLFFVPA